MYIVATILITLMTLFCGPNVQAQSIGSDSTIQKLDPWRNVGNYIIPRSTYIPSSTQYCLGGDCRTAWPVSVSTTPGGSNTAVQFNSGNTFAGTSTFTFNSSTGLLTVPSISSTNALFINASSTNLFASALTFTTANGTSLTTTNAFATNLGTTNFSATNGNFTNLTTTNFSYTNASGTTITSTRYYTNNPNSYLEADGTTGLAFFGGNVSVSGGYLYAIGAGTGLYVQNSSVFRGAISNDAGAGLIINGGTAGITSFINKIGINSTTPVATLGITGVAGTNPLLITSSTNAQLFAVKQNGQVVIGPNSLSQTGHQTLEHPTTNDYALTFTNGTHYTAMLGRQPGTSGQMAVGGLSGTSLNLWAGGSSRMIILNTNGYVGINSTTPSTQFVVVGTSTFNGAILQTNLGDCDASNQTVSYDLTTGQFGCGTDDNNDQRVGTSTANYFTFYDTATSVTGTSWVQFSGGALTVTTNTNFTIVSSTNGLFGSVTTTNLTVTGALSLPANSVTDAMVVAGLTISGGTIDNSPIGATVPSTGVFTNLTSTNFFATNVSSTNLTTTNFYVSGSLSLPANSITDAMVVPGLTISGGTIDNTPIGNTTPSTGIFTNVTTTNLFATNTVFINATSTNLFATSLTFTNASGTTITSTNGIFTNLTFTNATGTVLYLSSALNINNALTINSVGDVSASGTLRVFGTATFGADTNETFVRNLYRPVNRTTTIADYSSDPDTLNRGTGVATTLAVYTDDVTRILVQNTAAGASGIVSLKNKNLTPANTALDAVYNNGDVLQTITATTLSGGGGAATVRGVLTYQGYHYLMVVNGGVGTIKRATSSWDVDLSLLASWETATVVGSFDGSMLGLVGAYNGNIYMASNTDDILPYAITTSTNTLTAGTPITMSVNHSLNCTRVNDNGIMSFCDGTPQMRFYDFSGNRTFPFGGGFGASAPATAGPTIFVTRKSNYIINGSATALSKLNNVLTN